MLRRALLPAVGTSLAMLALGVTAGDRHRNSFRAFADLVPTQEVPVVSSVARGRFKATIDRANQTISYELSYEGLEAGPTQAHIHVGQRRVRQRIHEAVALDAREPQTDHDAEERSPDRRFRLLDGQ